MSASAELPLSPHERLTAPGVDELIGATLDGRFRIIEPIGAGGTSRVYRALEVPSDRPVALKVLDPELGREADSVHRKRFLREAELTFRLTHPNTVNAIAYGCSREGYCYLAMEYLEGETLFELLGRMEALPWRRALSIAEQVCRSLREAHRLGLVHRDLKPANVMLVASRRRADQVKVLDFGLAKSFARTPGAFERGLTEQGVLVGSAQYIAPEQADRNHADPRSDIYSLGVLLYEALTGRPPFSGRLLEVVNKHLSEEPPPMTTPRPELEIPPQVEALVRRCLAKAPEDRFQTMDEVLGALKAAALARRPPSRRAAPLSLLLASVGALVGAGAAIGFAQWRPPFLAPVPLEASPSSSAVTASERSRPSAAEPPSRPARAPEPEPAGIERIRFHVASIPTGAKVSLRGRTLGVTPLELDLPPGPDGFARAKLSFALPGYVPLTVSAVGSGPRVELTQKLEKATPRKKAKASKVKKRKDAAVRSVARLGDDEPDGSELKRPR